MLAVAAAVVLAVSAGCTPGNASTPTASPSITPSASSVTPTPSPTPSEHLDLLEEGAAPRLVERLLTAAGASRAIMVTVTQADASVAVVRGGVAETWAWRDGRVQQVQSDINYVAQREFDPSEFAFNDLGALFRAAQAVSGSASGQSLQIVDYSAGLVSMSVSTNPETRPVFFNADGTLLPTLDFSSAWGLKQGYDDVVGARGTTTGLGFGSALGVYLDSPQDAQGAFTRRQRTARTPVIVTSKTATTRLAAFDPARVAPATVWAVLEGLRAEGRFTLDMTWSCEVDDRAATGTPRMYFQVGDRSFVTDLLGNVVA